MPFSIDLGPYNAVFAVPTALVDTHMRLAGAVQLKVLLYILRHAGRPVQEEEMAQALGVSAADIKDALFYWQQAGLLPDAQEAAEPAPAPAPSAAESISPVDEAPVSTEETRLISSRPTPATPQTPAKKLAPHRVEKPDGVFLANRMASSSEIAALMQETEFILGRPLSPGLSSTLLYMHDDCGLPTDVIIMLVQYAKEQGKDNTHYIESTGRAWAQEGILSHEKAEQKLRYLDESAKAWRLVERALGISHRRPTAREMQFCARWVLTWHFEEAMLREAYERCINATGKLNFTYIDRILERWQREGVRTLSQAQQEASARTQQAPAPQAPSYDLDEFEKMSQWELMHKEK